MRRWMLARTQSFLTAALSYLANGPVGDPRLALLLEVGTDESSREYHFFLPDTLGLRSTTRIGTTAISDLMSRLAVLDGDVRLRVERSMHWHSVALGLDDPLERLQAILNAFEALNPVLADQLGVDRHEIRKCRSCGTETRVPVASGVHAWLRQECGETVARQTREMRNGLIHGFKTVEELYPGALIVLEAVERALMRAIAMAAGAVDIADLIGWPPLAPNIPFALALHGTCTGAVEAAYFSDGSLPELDPSFRIKSSQLLEDQAIVELEHTSVARLPPGVAVQLTGTSMPRDAGIALQAPPTLAFKTKDTGAEGTSSDAEF